MPPFAFVALIAAVIAAGGITIALAYGAGVPMAILGLSAVIGALMIRRMAR